MKLTDEQIEQRARIVAEQFNGLGMMDAVDVLGNACNMAAKKNSVHIAVPIYYIGKLIEEMHGRSALVKINDDGSLSFSIGANGVEQKLF